jgi:PAS domain S-box-containing protein
MNDDQRRSDLARQLRQTAEESLKAAEAEYRVLFDRVPSGLYRSTPDGQLLAINQALVDLLGYASVQELMDVNIASMFYQSVEERRQWVEKLLHIGEFRNVEIQVLRKDGSLLDLLENSRVVRNESGQVLFFEGSLTDITDRKRAEEALRERDIQFNKLSAHVPGMIYQFMMKPDGTYCVPFTTEAIRDIFGCSPQDVRSDFSPIAKVILPEDLEKVVGSIQYSAEYMTSWQCEYRVQIPGQPIRWMFGLSTPEKLADGSVIWHGFNTDITERKQVEEALRESESRYRELFEAESDAIVLIDNATGNILEANSAMTTLYGYTRDELLTKKNTDLSAEPEDTQRVTHGTPIISEQVVTIPLRFHRKKDGTVFPVEITGRFFIREGRPVHIAAIRDITDRKRAEEALRESEEKYRLLIENSHDILYTLTADGVFIFVSPAWTTLLGHPVAQVAGQPFQQFIHPDDIRGCMVFLHSVIETGQRQTGIEYRVQHADGSWRWHTSSAVPLRDETGTTTGFEGTARDITDRKQLEERIRQVRNDLLFAVSHDLKSPLQTLRQTQEMLNELTPDEGLARFQEYSEIWQRNLQRLERMINNLVDSQRSEEDRFPLLLAPCDPKELVKRVAEDLTGYALSSQVTFDLNLQSMPQISCDEEALGRVVENLLTNAIKFSQKGGHVEVRLKLEGDTLLLEVEDHGLGIPAQEQDRLFRPFQRGHSAHQKGIPGTGLGLYVSRRIVEEHGGTLTLTSEEGKGTVVTVRLPWGKTLDG